MANASSTRELVSLSPHIINVSPSRIQPAETKTVTITGSGFTPDSAVLVPSWGGTIDSVTVVSPTVIEIVLTAGAVETFYDVIVVSNGNSSDSWATNNGLNAIEVKASTWFDLRSGGDSLANFRTNAGGAFAQDADGLYNSGGVNPWTHWIKAEDPSLLWTRGDGKTLSYIYRTGVSYFMIGIGSTATNETDTAQYRQGEYFQYHSSGTQRWGFYGNNGTVGTTWSQSSAVTTTNSTFYRVEFTNDGSSGSPVNLYQLPSGAEADWDDVSNLVLTVNSLSPADELDLMPMMILRPNPSDPDLRVTAIKVE